MPIGQRYDLEVTYDQPCTAKLVNWVEGADASGNPTTTKTSSFTVDVAASDRVPRDIAWPSVTLQPRFDEHLVCAKSARTVRTRVSL